MVDYYAFAMHIQTLEIVNYLAPDQKPFLLGEFIGLKLISAATYQQRNKNNILININVVIHRGFNL